MNTKQKFAKSYWTFEICQIEALKYKTRSEFQKYSGSAYRKALDEGWLDEICPHTPKIRILNYDICKEISLKFESYQEFRKCESHVYNKIRNNNWLELFSHLKCVRIPRDRLIYAFEFNDNHVYVGLTCDSEERSKRHQNSEDSTVYQYIEDTRLEPIYKELTGYMEESKASIEEGVFEQYYIDNGWIILNKVKTGSLGGRTPIYTFDICLEEALKYDNYTDFRKNCTYLCNKAVHMDWISEICELANFNRRIRTVWTFELCQTEAFKYTRKIDFKTKSNMAYRIAIRNKWLEQICSHMINGNLYWTFEKCLEEYLTFGFKDSSNMGYRVAKRNGWLDNIYAYKN